MSSALSLDSLAANPGAAAALTPSERRAITLQCCAVLLAVATADAGSGPGIGPGMTAPPPADCAVSLVDAAKVLRMTEDTLYRKWKALGIGYKDADGRVKFSQQSLQRYIARRAGKPA